jgi:cation-transporting ATPase 13A2
MKFVLLMACIAVLGFICLLPAFLKLGMPSTTYIDRFLNLIVICVPPALPAAMSCGVAFAIFRLKSQKIFCISPPRVNLSGRITTFVFDKTGTLTEDGLSVQGFRCVKEDDSSITFKEFYADVNDLNPPLARWWETKQAKEFRNLPSTLFLESLACCCGVTYVNGGLIGDPLDVKMFQSTGWILDEAQNIPSEESISTENVEIVATLYPPNSRSSRASSMSNTSDMSGITKPAYVSELVRRFDFSSAL